MAAEIRLDLSADPAQATRPDPPVVRVQAHAGEIRQAQRVARVWAIHPDRWAALEQARVGAAIRQAPPADPALAQVGATRPDPLVVQAQDRVGVTATTIRQDRAADLARIGRTLLARVVDQVLAPVGAILLGLLAVQGQDRVGATATTIRRGRVAGLARTGKTLPAHAAARAPRPIANGAMIVGATTAGAIAASGAIAIGTIVGPA